MRIGSIDIEKPLLLAPMEDVTDVSFRIICKRLGADIVYTEFVNSEGLVRESKKTKAKMHFLEEERPIGIQIYGSSDASMGAGAQLTESLEPDLIDINCGCWVKNVAGHGAGAGLLRDLTRMEQIVSSVVKSVELPVTVKTRLGWDAESIKIVDVAKMVEQTGASALTIHCRTRAQGHKGDPDYSWIPQVKAAVSIPIFVNGGANTPQDVKKIFDETGCDGVMIARGAIDNPWIFKETKHFLATGEVLPPPTLDERMALLFEHMDYAISYKGEKKAVIEFRKHYAAYLKGYPNASKTRISLMPYVEKAPIAEILHNYARQIREQDLTQSTLATA
jgi:tRNA-dihydrouridine synthase B